MPTVTLKISDQLQARLDAVAREVGTSRSAFIRDAIEKRLAAVSRVAAGSVLERAADLVGCVEGPEDLASDPRHLEGYGG